MFWALFDRKERKWLLVTYIFCHLVIFCSVLFLSFFLHVWVSVFVCTCTVHIRRCVTISYSTNCCKLLNWCHQVHLFLFDFLHCKFSLMCSLALYLFFLFFSYDSSRNWNLISRLSRKMVCGLWIIDVCDLYGDFFSSVSLHLGYCSIGR